MKGSRGIRATAQKDSRLSIRASEHKKAVIARAARIRNTTLSEFVVENAYQTAQEVIAEQTQFTLGKKEWKLFCEALDAPPKSVKAIKRLLTTPSVFDAER